MIFKFFRPAFLSCGRRIRLVIMQFFKLPGQQVYFLEVTTCFILFFSNSISGQNPNAELLAGQLILSSRAIGGLDVFLAPFFPDSTMLITSFNNLSIYWQKGTMRRLMKDEPEYNRIATYQSINDAYVVEDYGKCAMVTGLKFADS